MNTRSLSRLLMRDYAPAGASRTPTRGASHKSVLPGCGRAGRPGPHARTSVRAAREQAEGAKASSNYWSSTTNANCPTNAWNVNFNDGNVNNIDKNNALYARAVRGGL